MTPQTEQPERPERRKYPFGINRKIWLSLSILVLGYLATTVFGFVLSGKTSRSLADVAEDLFPAAVESQIALTAFKEEIALYSDGVMLGDVDAVEVAQERSEVAKDALESLIVELAGHGEQRARAQGLLTELTAFTERATPVYRALASNVDDEALGDQAMELAESFERITGELEDQKVALADYLKRDLEDVSRTTRHQQYFNLALFVVVVGSALFLVSLIVTRSITRPLRKTMEFARVMAAGDLSQKLDIRQHDEIGELARAINVMAGELERSQSNLEQQVRERTAELEQTHKELMIAARQAGMADVASAVLHNVGNVLTSVNVTTSTLRARLDESKVTNLARAAELLQQHAEDLCSFLTEDPKGRKVPGYVIGLSEHLSREREEQAEMVDSLVDHVQHITTIISRQQSQSRAAAVREQVDPRELLEDAIQMCLPESVAVALVERDYEPGCPQVVLDRHKAIQIVVNLIKNAKQAVDERAPEGGVVRISLHRAEGELVVAVADNGIGIREENLARLFTHGFTTKEQGHGYGLHSACLAAKEMGGALTARSDGENRGAVFTLTLPLQTPEVANA